MSARDRVGHVKALADEPPVARTVALGEGVAQRHRFPLRGKLRHRAAGSDVEVLDFQGVLLDVLAATLDVVTHKDAEEAFGLFGLFERDAQ